MTLEENITRIPTPQLFNHLTKLDNFLDGRYLSLEDNIFVENVIADIQHFVRGGEDNRKSVLLFPPVNNYRRFLIHKVCEENLSGELSTFSVGQGFHRRTVVCLKNLVRKPSVLNKSHDQPVQNLGEQISNAMVVERQPISSVSSSPEHHSQNGTSKKVRAAPAIYRPPAARKLEALSAQVKQSHSITSVTPTTVTSVASKTERTRSGTRQRRPDLQVYVPRAKRASMIDQKVTESCSDHHEMFHNNHDMCADKKNESELSLKLNKESDTSNFDKSNDDVLPPTLSDIDSNDATSVRKIDEDNLTIAKNSGNGLTENSTDIESSPHSFKNNVFKNCDSDSASIIIGCETDNQGVNNINEKNCEMIICESEELLLSSSDLDIFDYNCDECNEKNSYKENNSDSKISLHSVNISDTKESGVECTLYNSEESKNHENERSKDGNCYVEEPLDSSFNDERILQPRDLPGNTLSKSRNQENHKDEKNICKRLVSDVLIISEPETSIKSGPTIPKKEVNLVKDNSISKKSKSKHKSVNCTVAEKTEITSSTDDTVSTTASVSLNPDECTWEMLFDDNGDCLDPKIMEELTSAVGSVTIEKPQSDYNRFISKPEINLPGGDSEFSHVVEIYNFPPEFKTQDLLAIFAPYKNGGFEIKWVDDTHALGVFCSSRVAADVLAYDHPFVKTRPLSEATPESRVKAKRSAEFLQPYRARPETCVAMARRLVTGALGMRISTSREEREAERRLLKEARDKRRLAAQQQQDAWEGTIR